MSADWVARGTAIGSAAVAVASLGWNVVAWRRQGPVLRVRATCTGRGNDMQISGSVRNTGRFDAHIQRAEFRWMASSGASGSGGPTVSCDLPADHIDGLNLPAPLLAQAGCEFTVTDLNGIDLGLSVALHDRRPVTLKFHTASGKTAKGKVKYKKSV